ncbi:MAG: HNH nuclease domain-containing protein [Cenarchaeum symbiont of Oopsacas minuta]|nr:HNH nuclease domain-containing protein [Cenarchaeum symbiont of Oopsacas minuta]
MAREIRKSDYTQDEVNNLKNKLCWCGKPRSEFEKYQRVYCSSSHATEWFNRTMPWSVYRDKVLEERGEKCVKCGVTSESAKTRYAKALKKYLKDVKTDKEFMQRVEREQLKEIQEIDERYKRVLDIDKFILENMPYSMEGSSKFPRPNSNELYPAYEVDHIKAVALGGDSWNKENLQILCSSCHKVKTKLDMTLIKNNRKPQTVLGGHKK